MDLHLDRHSTGLHNIDHHQHCHPVWVCRRQDHIRRCRLLEMDLAHELFLDLELVVVRLVKRLQVPCLAALLMIWNYVVVVGYCYWDYFH